MSTLKTTIRERLAGKPLIGFDTGAPSKPSAMAGVEISSAPHMPHAMNCGEMKPGVRMPSAMTGGEVKAAS